LMGILANLGVIAGIVFLGIELRQNNALMKSQARATMTQLATAVWTTLIEQPDIAVLLLKDRRGEELSDEDELRLDAVFIRGLYFSQYQFEEDPERFAITNAESLRGLFSAYGSLRRMWSGDREASAAAGKRQFIPSFVKFIDENIANQSTEQIERHGE